MSHITWRRTLTRTGALPSRPLRCQEAPRSARRRPGRQPSITTALPVVGHLGSRPASPSAQPSSRPPLRASQVRERRRAGVAVDRPLTMDVMTTGQSVSVDALNEQASAWQNAVRQAEAGQSVAIISHGEHVADVVPSGELERLRETIEVLSDAATRADLDEAKRSIEEGDVLRGADAIRAVVENRK